MWGDGEYVCGSVMTPPVRLTLPHSVYIARLKRGLPQGGHISIPVSYTHLDVYKRQPVVPIIKPIFADLSHRNLLRKYLHGSTQNANE